jgi:hypothetical protein
MSLTGTNKMELFFKKQMAYSNQEVVYVVCLFIVFFTISIVAFPD